MNTRPLASVSLRASLVAAVLLALLRAAHGAQTTSLYATSVPAASPWSAENNAIGGPVTPGCSGPETKETFAKESSGSLTWLVATDFGAWSLPSSHMVTRVEVGVWCRFSAPPFADSIDIDAFVDGMWRTVVTDYDLSANPPTCRWFSFDVTDLWPGTSLRCTNPSRIDNMQVRVRRSSVPSKPTEFDVNAFRINVTTDIDSDSDCVADIADPCPGNPDLSAPHAYFRDNDLDGFGDPTVTTSACSQPSGYVANNADCDDTSSSIRPTAAEVCNGIDDDCDTQIDDGTCLNLVAFCFGDGSLADHTTACPCGNDGAAGHGCAHSQSTSGARLSALGSTQPDTVVLYGDTMPTSSLCIYIQTDALADVVYGDGVVCSGSNLTRLRQKSNLLGASQFPQPGDPSVSVRGGVTPGSGVRRYYFTYYRNVAATFCPPETYNVTNGVMVDW